MMNDKTLKVGSNELELVDFRLYKKEPDGGIYCMTIVQNLTLGVFNLRGNVLPLIDLRVKFGVLTNNIDENTRFIVMKIKDGDVAFIIDRLTSALRIKKKTYFYRRIRILMRKI